MLQGGQRGSPATRKRVRNAPANWAKMKEGDRVREGVTELTPPAAGPGATSRTTGCRSH